MIRDGHLYCDECGGVILAKKAKSKPATAIGGKVFCSDCNRIWEHLVADSPSRNQIGRIVWLVMWWEFIIALAIWAAWLGLVAIGSALS